MARKKAAPQPVTSGTTRAAAFLEEALPFAEPAAVEVHQNAAILEVSEAAQLVELAADQALRPLLLCRLSSNVALVDPGRADELADVLRKRGLTPKIIKTS